MKKRVTVKSYWLSKILHICVALCFCFALAKLFYVAAAPTVSGIDLKEFAASRNEKTKIIHASRGTIYDSSGEALAVSVNSYTLIAYLNESRTTNENDPQHVVDKLYTAQKLAPVLDMEESEVLKYLEKDAYQVEFGSKGRDLTEREKKRIDELELPGIDFIEGTQRYYKMGDFASYIIGYAKNTDDGDIKGELGIEGYYNPELSGTDGKLVYQSDAYGYQLPNVPYVQEDAISGEDIYLTIDSNVQLIAENAINTLEENYKFDFAIMAVMDAKTGALVASATSPSYNPNNLNTLTEYLNPLVSDPYEPGSTMKIFSWASAMEEGIYDGDKTYESGSVPVDNYVIRDWVRQGWGTISYDTGFMYSSNVGATNLALEMGTATLTDYYHKFGFGEKTGIGLAGEDPGLINFTYKTELATAAFGQGKVLVTPIQLLQALTAISNDGIMLQPYVVQKRVNDQGEVVYEHEVEEVGRVMKESTVKKLQELMYKTNYEGLSKMWQPDTVSMMIKTGTSQITEGGKYLDGEYDNIYSLAGIFPHDDPKYIIYVAVKRIEGSQVVVADMTTKAVDEIASYANIAKETTTEYADKIINVSNYKSKLTADVKNELEAEGLMPIILGDGKYVINQYPQKGTKIVAGSKVFIVTNMTNYVMPNMLDWSLSDVSIFASLTGVNLTYTGYGYVKSQSIAEGEQVNSESNLAIELYSKTINDKLQKVEELDKEEGEEDTEEEE